MKQDGTTKDMLFRIPKLIHHVSTIMTLEVRLWHPLTSAPQDRTNALLFLSCISQEGDLILTGTPSGVGAVSPGEKVECTLKDASGKVLATLDFNAVQREGGYHYQPA